ncbi:MAG: tetratricopeptide repeat protein [Deltaproteobacteria bacterium]|nr:tetratricopeptide repeat protein [Deltaproteobacteria bacterium]
MRIFSRLSSWMRSPNDAPLLLNQGDLQRMETGASGHALSPERLPETSANQFRGRLQAAVRTCASLGKAQVYRLDPTVQVLVLPTAADSLPGEDIDLAIRQIQSEGRLLSSLTWSSLREARPNFSPSYLEWAREPELFEGGIGLVFFLDGESITMGLVEVIRGLGFTAMAADDFESVTVSDGTYHARIGIHAVIAEALWTAVGPASVVQRRGQRLASEFRSFQGLHKGLRRHFPDVQFETYAGRIRAITAEKTYHLDYRHLAAAQRVSGISVDAWLSRVLLQDLIAMSGEPGVLVRSSNYLKAYPDVVHEVQEGHVLIAVRVGDDGRVQPVYRTVGAEKEELDPPGRFEHYLDEAERQMSFTRFDAHVFILEDERKVDVEKGMYTPFVACFVGDAVATLVLDPRLLRGALEGLVPSEGRVRAKTIAEDIIVVASVGCSDELIKNALRKAEHLEKLLTDDPSDPLQYDEELQLPALAAGFFRLTLVDETYFDALGEAAQLAVPDPGQAAYFEGVALQCVGRTEKAVACYERAARHLPDDGDVMLALGRALVQVGNHERAVPLLRAAKAVLPEHAEVENAYGLALYAVGKVAEARKAFEQATTLVGDEPAFWVNLGRCLFDQDLLQEAIDATEKAVSLDPISAEAHSLMALLWHREGDVVLARHHARESLSEEPDDPTMMALLTVLDDIDDDDNDDLEEKEDGLEHGSEHGSEDGSEDGLEHGLEHGSEHGLEDGLEDGDSEVDA